MSDYPEFYTANLAFVTFSGMIGFCHEICKLQVRIYLGMIVSINDIKEFYQLQLVINILYVYMYALSACIK